MCIDVARGNVNNVYSSLVLLNCANYFKLNLSFEAIDNLFKIRINTLNLNVKL